MFSPAFTRQPTTQTTRLLGNGKLAVWSSYIANLINYGSDQAFSSDIKGARYYSTILVSLWHLHENYAGLASSRKGEYLTDPTMSFVCKTTPLVASMDNYKHRSWTQRKTSGSGRSAYCFLTSVYTLLKRKLSSCTEYVFFVCTYRSSPLPTTWPRWTLDSFARSRHCEFVMVNFRSLQNSEKGKVTTVRVIHCEWYIHGTETCITWYTTHSKQCRFSLQ